MASAPCRIAHYDPDRRVARVVWPDAAARMAAIRWRCWQDSLGLDFPASTPILLWRLQTDDITTHFQRHSGRGNEMAPEGSEHSEVLPHLTRLSFTLSVNQNLIHRITLGSEERFAILLSQPYPTRYSKERDSMVEGARLESGGGNSTWVRIPLLANLRSRLPSSVSSVGGQRSCQRSA